MSQQPNDSPPDQSMEPLQDSPPPTSGHAAPVTVPQGAASSTSFSLSVAIPPQDRDLNSHFSRISQQAFFPASSPQPQDLLRTLLISSRSNVVALSNVVPRIGPVPMPGTNVGTCSVTSTLPPNISSMPLSHSDSVTWTETVSQTFPREQLVARASSTFSPNLTDAYQPVISTPLSATSSTQGLSNRIEYRHSSRRTSLHQPSAGSSSEVAVRPIAALQSNPNVTSWPVPVVASSLRTVETSSLYDYSMQPPDSTTGPTPTVSQLGMAPSFLSQLQSYQPLPPSPTCVDFPAQLSMNSPTRPTLENICNRVSHSIARSSSRNCPYSRSVTDMSGQRVIDRSRRFPDLQTTPLTTERATHPVTEHSSDDVLGRSVNPAILPAAQDMAYKERLLIEKEYLYRLKRKLEERKFDLARIDLNARNFGESSIEASRKLVVPQINDLQSSVAKQKELVHTLQLNLRAREFHQALVRYRDVANWLQSQGRQPEMRVETDEEGIWHHAARSPQRPERQPEMDAEEVEEEEISDQQMCE